MENTTKKLKSENIKFSFMFIKEDITKEIMAAYLQLEHSHVICVETHFQTINSILQAKQNINQENITSIHTDNNNVLSLVTYDDLAKHKGLF